MPKQILNIGLDTTAVRGPGSPDLAVADVLDALDAFQIDDDMFYASVYSHPISGERTLVADIYGFGLTPTEICTLAEILDQEAIASLVIDYTVEGKSFSLGGELAGPAAEAWGEFNPAFFILPDGGLLSDKGDD